METREVLKALQVASRRPDNRLVLKMSLMIMSSQEYKKQDGTKGYIYQGWDTKTESIIKFMSSRLLEKGKPSEVLLTLTGFSAFERLA